MSDNPDIKIMEQALEGEYQASAGMNQLPSPRHVEEAEKSYYKFFLGMKTLIIAALLLVGTGCVATSEAAEPELNDQAIRVIQIQTEYGYCLIGYFGVDAKPFLITSKI